MKTEIKSLLIILVETLLLVLVTGFILCIPSILAYIYNYDKLYLVNIVWIFFLLGIYFIFAIKKHINMLNDSDNTTWIYTQIK